MKRPMKPEGLKCAPSVFWLVQKERRKQTALDHLGWAA